MISAWQGAPYIAVQLLKKSSSLAPRLQHYHLDIYVCTHSSRVGLHQKRDSQGACTWQEGAALVVQPALPLPRAERADLHGAARGPHQSKGACFGLRQSGCPQCAGAGEPSFRFRFFAICTRERRRAVRASGPTTGWLHAAMLARARRWAALRPRMSQPAHDCWGKLELGLGRGERRGRVRTATTWGHSVAACWEVRSACSLRGRSVS